MFKSINLKKLIISLVIPYAAGVVSWLLSRSEMQTYSALDLPPLSPPGTVFPIAWGILYLLMGIALYRIAASYIPQQKKSLGYLIFGIQLVFNALWTLFFFTLGLYAFSAVWLGVLVILIIINIAWFYRLDKASAYLMLPYLLWCIYAMYLNIGIAVLN